VDLGEKTRRMAEKRQKSAGFQAIRGKLTSGGNRKSTLTNDWSGFFHIYRLTSLAG
jgi:hypothetical protein